MADSVDRWQDDLDLAKTGSGSALGRLLEKATPYLNVVADEELDSDLRAKEGVSDLVQKSLMEAAKDFAAFHGTHEGEFRVWLCQILRNNIRDLMDRYLAARRQIDREIPLADERITKRIAGTESESPSGLAVRREEVAVLKAAIQKLSSEQQEIIRLRHEEHKSFSEIGEVLGVTEKAAQKRWSRAIEELREMIHGEKGRVNADSRVEE